MERNGHKSSLASGKKAVFQNTRWSQVIAAGISGSAHSPQALEELCRLYWYPLYAYLRRSGRDSHQAEDLVQGFFAYLLHGKILQRADPTRGQFRSFLLGTLKNYVSHERAKEGALKRGGGAEVVPIDAAGAEEKYSSEPAAHWTPEDLYDRRWAMTVTEEAMRRLEGEYRQAGMSEVFLALQPYLTGDAEKSFAELGARLKLKAGAARTHVCRLRKRYRHFIRAVIGDTVADVEQAEMEYEHLKAALRGK